MSESDLFHSATNSTGEKAGVFEFEDDTAYFYLYDTGKADGSKILGAIHIFSGVPDFDEDDIEIRWSATDTHVGFS